LSFEEAPNEVSLGAQKAFSGTRTPPTKGLVGRIANQWDKNCGKDFNEIWYKRAIAKAIFFREVDKMVFKSPWYSGYKANIVTYTLAKFANMVRKANLSIDFLATWETQSVADELMPQLALVAEKVNAELCSPPEGGTSNISEWAKKPACWDIIEKLDIKIVHDARSLLIDLERSKEQEKDGTRTQVIQDSIHAQTYVFEKGAEYWKLLRDWNRIAKKLTPNEISILNIACSIPRTFPTDKQAKLLLKGEQRSIEEGFFVG